jgi:hypothetical protein
MTKDWKDMDDYGGTHRTSVGEDWGAMVIDHADRIAGFVPMEIMRPLLERTADVTDAEFTETTRTIQ